MATLISNQSFNGSSIISIQELLLSLAEYVTANITSSTIVNQQAVLQAIQQTLFNALNIINAVQLQNLASQEYSLLQNVLGILSFLSPIDQTFITNRVNSLNALATTIYPLPLSLLVNINNLTNGIPALQSYDLASYFITFNSELVPGGLTTSTFLSTIQAMATAWLDALNYLTNSGNALQLTAYNPTDRMYNCSQFIYNLLTNITLASGINVSSLWNSLISTPTLLSVLDLLYNDPSSTTSQGINAIKFLILNLIYQTNIVLSTFAVPSIVPQPATATLKMNESLMDFAARTTGNFEQWTVIAQANNLMPPYVGTVAAPGIAVPGQMLFLPPFSNNNLPLANYSSAFLGTDVDFGLPGTTLQNWGGDFSLTKGINNYIGALVRRVLTPVGSLIYHSTYGSLLPQEVGSIQTANEAMLQASYLKNALLQDPRTQTVNSISAYPVNFGAIVLTALVTPYGGNSTSPLNLVIVPRNASTNA